MRLIAEGDSHVQGKLLHWETTFHVLKAKGMEKKNIFDGKEEITSNKNF